MIQCARSFLLILLSCLVHDKRDFSLNLLVNSTYTVKIVRLVLGKLPFHHEFKKPHLLCSISENISPEVFFPVPYSLKCHLITLLFKTFSFEAVRVGIGVRKWRRTKTHKTTSPSINGRSHTLQTRI